MVLEFTAGPGKAAALPKEQASIRACIRNYNSYCWRVNQVYNNVHHFSFPQYNYDTNDFLLDMWDTIKHPIHKLQIMGSGHRDPFGHTSGMIGQYGDMGEFVPALVQDSYVRFQVVLDPKDKTKTRVLQPGPVYHFLLRPPKIVRLQFPHSPVWMHSVDRDLVPSSKYKKNAISWL